MNIEPHLLFYFKGVQKMRLIAEWSNGVKREFDDLDELNVIINKAELTMWCKEHHYNTPKFIVVD